MLAVLMLAYHELRFVRGLLTAAAQADGVQVDMPSGWLSLDASVRAEVLVMASLVPVLYADAGTPLENTTLASDAQGSGELSDSDHGGYGIVVSTDVEHQRKDLHKLRPA